MKNRPQKFRDHGVSARGTRAPASIERLAQLGFSPPLIMT